MLQLFVLLIELEQFSVQTVCFGRGKVGTCIHAGLSGAISIRGVGGCLSRSGTANPGHLATLVEILFPVTQQVVAQAYLAFQLSYYRIERSPRLARQTARNLNSHGKTTRIRLFIFPPLADSVVFRSLSIH
jgi:hypothetical protein